MAKAETIEIENVLQPGKTYRVDAAKFAAMRDAVLAVLPAASPGLTPAALKAAALPLLPGDLFPGGDKAGWWLKTVQLDQEAKASSPARSRRRFVSIAADPRSCSMRRDALPGLQQARAPARCRILIWPTSPT